MRATLLVGALLAVGAAGAGARVSFAAGAAPPNIVFIKIYKCASSTTSGIARRLAAHHGLSGFRLEHWRPGSGAPGSEEPGVMAHHATYALREEHALGRLALPAFVFTFVREPAARCLSQYYHMRVSLEDDGARPTTRAKLSFLRAGRARENALQPRAREGPRLQISACRDFMATYMAPARATNVSDVERAYDFIGVLELFDESLVLMARRFAIPLGELLYTRAKVADGAHALRDGGRLARHPPLADEPAPVREYLAGAFRAHNALDYALYERAARRVRAAFARDPALNATLATFRALGARARALRGSVDGRVPAARAEKRRGRADGRLRPGAHEVLLERPGVRVSVPRSLRRGGGARRRPRATRDSTRAEISVTCMGSALRFCGGNARSL